MGHRLLVIVPDRLSSIVEKGEIVERYYNPGDVFDEVHVATTNDDRPDLAAAQPLVGSARLFVHNLPISRRRAILSLGSPRLLRRWAADAVRLAAEIRPDLVRCYGVDLNAFAAAEIRRRLGVPYVLSLHGNPDLDIRRHPYEGVREWRAKLEAWGKLRIEKVAIRDADCVVCVYDFIVPYARRMHGRRIERIYNIVATHGVTPKQDYAISRTPRAIVLGRQWPRKNPAPVIEALVDLPQVELTLVGTGPVHASLRRLADAVGVADRCRFLPSLSNEVLCHSLHEWDALVSVNDYGGVSKVELEAGLIGMPVVTNRHPYEREPEVLGGDCLVVDGDARSYAAALRRLFSDDALRARLGTGLRQRVEALGLETMEERFADVHRDVLRISTPHTPTTARSGM